jgi:hypothetical protein
MQRQNSSKSHRLDRRKSTSSVRSVHLVHIHPDQAEHDAQNAAIQAFSRARDRSSASTSQWPPIRDNASGLGRRNSSSSDRQTPSTPRRQRSVRFVKPRASPTRSTNEPPLSIPSGQSGPRVCTTQDQGENRPSSNTSEAATAFAAKRAADDYINALITGEEYYTPEDNIASAPSSYRRLRKSRSMFTSSKTRGEQGFLFEDPLSATMQHLPRPANATTPRSILRAPKSMSFLRSRTGNSHMSIRKPVAPVPADKGTSPNRPEYLFHRSSTHFRSKPHKLEQAFKKTLRNVSNGTIPAKVSKDGSLRSKARKVSQNFRHKLKGLFNISRDGSTTIPPQQVEARKTHVVDAEEVNAHIDAIYSDGLETENTTISRVTSGVPSLHAVPSEQQLRSRQGSLESMPSEGKTSDEKSRVTSWTESDTNTFGTFNSSRGEWEKQRLSVIKENGAHIPSPSAPHTSTGSQGAHHGGSINKGLYFGSSPPTKVDGQRIYSALMKRLDESRRPPNVEERRKRSVEDFMAKGVIPNRNGSKGFKPAERSRPVTVRHVTSLDDLESASLPGSPAENIMPSVHPKMDTRGLSMSSSESLSIPQIKTRPPPSRTLSERSSVFFGSPTCHLFRTQSPYRRAIQGSMRSAVEAAPPKSPEFNPWMKAVNGINVRCPSASASEIGKMAYTESIYSSDDVEPQNSLSIINKISDPPIEHGDATIFLDPPNYQPIAMEKQSRRATSSASSTEWQSWLSANVSKLEQLSLSKDDFTMDDGGFGFPKPLTSSGHVRESAQISHDEGQDILGQTSLSENRHPTTSPIAPVERHPDPASPRSSSDQEKDSASLLVESTHCSVSPPIPAKNEVKPVSSLPDSESSKEVWGKPSENARIASSHPDRLRRLTHARSLNALRIQDQNISTGSPRTVKLQARPRSYAPSSTTPGIVAATERQFGNIQSSSMDSKRRSGPSTPTKSENISPRAMDDDDPYSVQGSGVLGPGSGLVTQSMGSRHMVDQFLGSRRRRIAGTDDSDVFL